MGTALHKPEASPMIACVWGEVLGPVVARLIVERPSADLGRRLALAPRRVIHGLAIFLWHAQETSRQNLAEEIATRDVRELLAEAMPDAHPRLYGLLAKLDPVVKPMGFYRHMNRALHGPSVELILAADTINPHSLEVLEALVLDPALLAAQGAIGISASNLHLMQCMFSFLRATNLALDIERLPPGSGWSAIRRRIASDLGRAAAPPLPFRCPAGWRHVATMADLWRIGGELNNCVAKIGGGGDGHFVQFITGAQVFFVNDQQPPVLVAIQKISSNLWSADDMTPSFIPEWDAFSAALGEVLAEAGHVLLEMSPDCALSSICARAERRAGDQAEDDIVEQAA